jgi:CubicO group peptidase (beta-lactamase class C family)
MLGYTASAPLAWDPGTEQSYCSVGYVMLGAIIAGVTDQPYADAVAAHILGPVGMTATAPGRTLAADRLDGEVTYADHSPALDESVMAEGERASRPYGGAFNLENRLAGGGWVSTAADVVRFGRAFMRGDLTADPAAIMADELGWPDHFAQRDRATGHTGSMEGNHALLMCFGPDDENPVIANACWSFLFNKSPPKDIIDPVTGAEEEPRDILAFALANDVLGALLEL